MAPSAAKAKQNAELLKSVQAMDQKLQAVEHKMASPSLLNSDDKYFVERYQLYLDLIWLNAEVGTGGADVVGGADFRPTDAQLELLKQYEGALSGVQTEYQKLMKDDLPALNRVLVSSNIAAISAGL